MTYSAAVRRFREGLGTVADILGILGGIAFIVGLAGNIPGFVTVIETWARSGSLNVALMVGGAILVLIDIASRLFGGGRQRTPIAATPTSAAPPQRPNPPPPADSPRRLTSAMTPGELVALWNTDGLTSLEQRGLAAPHMGHWLPITGEVDDVNTYGDFARVVIKGVRDARTDTRVSAKFERDIDRVTALRKGMPIAITGKFAGISFGNWIDMDECEFGD
jgi:hypothetical protein